MLGKLLRAAVDVVGIPIAVMKDVVTLGGISTEQDKPYTAQKVDELIDDLDDIR